MTIADIVELHAALNRSEIRYWITGGWGVDALVGQQTRPHNDLDISVGAADLDDTLALLADMGYGPHTDWLPTRIATIGGIQVPCISAALQLDFHTGYELQEKDIADLTALRQAGLIYGGAT